ncbi:MAG: DUF116 domain-containing protein [candidate division Zixibacteria bacterium]|nr:DUF116 domain-containing protein [candidate division Zixibacteria bacterium]
MKKKPTITYRIEDDFYKKLEKFTQKTINDGFKLFENEFVNIDSFYKKTFNEDPKRSDHSFRQTAKPFYLIEAMYYHLLDSANREDFNKAEKTIIILPDCLSYLGDKCKREKTELGKICTRCVPKCEINKIMEIADKYNIKGYFSKRALVEQLTKIKEVEKTTLSVIGISCLLTLASGMRQAKEAGLPSRGVFLNFTGCDHWADKPFATETAVDRIKSILEEKYGIPDSTA